MWWKQPVKVILACDLYCCLLKQREALRACHSTPCVATFTTKAFPLFAYSGPSYFRYALFGGVTQNVKPLTNQNPFNHIRTKNMFPVINCMPILACIFPITVRRGSFTDKNTANFN